MLVNYCGWDVDRGSISCDIYINENKNDHEICYADGSMLRQNSTFQTVERDWNNDGDIYSQYGAWFNEIDRKGDSNGNVFLTPEELVRMVVDDYLEGYNEIVASDIVIPFVERDKSLDDRIELINEAKEKPNNVKTLNNDHIR